MVKVDLGRIVNGFQLISISQLGFDLLCRPFEGAFNPPREFFLGGREGLGNQTCGFAPPPQRGRQGTLLLRLKPFSRGVFFCVLCTFG